MRCFGLNASSLHPHTLFKLILQKHDWPRRQTDCQLSWRQTLQMLWFDNKLILPRMTVQQILQAEIKSDFVFWLLQSAEVTSWSSICHTWLISLVCILKQMHILLYVRIQNYDDILVSLLVLEGRNYLYNGSKHQLWVYSWGLKSKRYFTVYNKTNTEHSSSPFQWEAHRKHHIIIHSFSIFSLFCPPSLNKNDFHQTSAYHNKPIYTFIGCSKILYCYNYWESVATHRSSSRNQL